MCLGHVFTYVYQQKTTLTSLRKSSSLNRSLRSRMSACRFSSEAHLRFCRTVRVRFPVSWQNLSKWERSAHTCDRPAGGVARGLGGLKHNRWVRLITDNKENRVYTFLKNIGVFLQFQKGYKQFTGIGIYRKKKKKKMTQCRRCSLNFFSVKRPIKLCWRFMDAGWAKTLLSLTGNTNMWLPFYLFIKCMSTSIFKVF